MAPDNVETFINRWTAASPSERANSQLFLVELCDILGVPRPSPQTHEGYCFEFSVPQHHRDGSITSGRIDLYKRGCFVLESKQFHAKQAEQTDLELAAEEAGAIQSVKKKSAPVRGTEKWDDAMTKARGQAERYIRSLPQEEPTPPFLIVVDVGHTFEIYADFTQAGKAYLPFPDPRTFRIRLADLQETETREKLKAIWTDPYSLDPARKSAAVTREIAGHLAELAKSLEAEGHTPQTVAEFLSRCLFCMFAEDVGLLPERSFTTLLHEIPADGTGFETLLSTLFREMNTGTGKDISIVLRKKLLQFNGGLFADDTVLPLNGLQLGLLRAASKLDWKSVEPAIFGTLLERALNPHERHKLGAHYTPRAYVERLVLPTIIEPLREEWEAVRAAALTQARGDKLKEARNEILGFHKKLCEIKVLDPACGSGNFLYVTLEHMKRLEGEVLDEAAKYGENFKLELGGSETVDPHQFLGIEINPRAASVAELVLWIGYLQWHFRTHGKRTPHEPILRNFHNIECRDAVLAYDGEPEPVRDEQGNIKTVWNRRSFKSDFLTGREVPDEQKRVPLLRYKNARPTAWPMADYVIGNPPFLGNKRMRAHLGDGYTETLRETYQEIPESADFVMYWWHKAGLLATKHQLKRFGLITTNSLRQTFNRKILHSLMSPAKVDPPNSPLRLSFAIPDHPWVDTEEGASVRIAMTVAVPLNQLIQGNYGKLCLVIHEKPKPDGSSDVTLHTHLGIISPDLTIGADVANAFQLQSNEGLSNQGVTPLGTGFRLSPDEANEYIKQNPNSCKIIKPYAIGKDLVQLFEPKYIIDFFGLSKEEARTLYPDLFQHVLNTVKPERDQKERGAYRDKWWIFAEPRSKLRPALLKLARYIATCRTSKYRLFTFLEGKTIPDAKIVAVALDDAFALGVLSSRLHLVWALATGARLGVGNDPNYNHSECFTKFPFPSCTNLQKEKVRFIAERLEEHRKNVQEHTPNLTLTGMYNVLEKIIAKEALSSKEQQIHNQGLVSILKQLHDDLDAAVFEAYGWPPTLTDAEILERVVTLNAERAKEESEGLIRWLRPEYQNPQNRVAEPTLNLEPGKAKPSKGKSRKATPAKVKKLAWPATLAERVKAVSTLLQNSSDPLTPEQVTARFSRAKLENVQEILETLVTMGHAQRTKEKHYSP